MALVSCKSIVLFCSYLEKYDWFWKIKGLIIVSGLIRVNNFKKQFNNTIGL